MASDTPTRGAAAETRADRPEFATPSSAPTRGPLFVALLSVAVIAAAVAGVVTRGTDTAEAATYRNAFVQGESRTYDFSMNMDMEMDLVGVAGEGPISGGMTATMTMSVVEVKEDGSAVVDVTISNVRMQGLPPEGNPFTGQQEQSMRMTIAPDGHIVSVESGSLGLLPLGGAGLAGEASPTGQSSSQFFFPQFPDGEIAPGDTWSETQEVPLIDEETRARLEEGGTPFPLPEEASFEVTVDGRHDGFEETEYGRTAKIHQDIHMPMDLEFPFGALLTAFIDGFGGAFGETGQPAPTVPPELMEAVMIMQGNMDMAADTLVRVEDGDLVRMDGEMDMDMRMEMRNLPEEFSQGAPTDITMRGTMTMHMLRTG